MFQTEKENIWLLATCFLFDSYCGGLYLSKRTGGLGATIVARHAGEMVSEMTLAIVGNLGLKTLEQVIHPYPTQAEAIKQAADAYNRTRLTPFLKGLLARWLTWRR